MAEFVCKVGDASGRVFSQVEAAVSITEARQKLSDRGLFVYQVRPRDGVVGQALGRRSSAHQVPGNDFLVFNQQFNTLIKAGIPITKALDLLADRAASPKLRPVLGEVRRLVREGTPLSAALEQQGAFPKVYTVSILAGEKSGNLSGVLEYYIAYQRVTTGLRKKLISTLIYPVILICAAAAIVTYLVSSVIPKFAVLYNDLNINLPQATRILLAVTVTYRPYLLGFLAVLMLVAAAAFVWSRSDKGGLFLERLRMRLPLIGDTLMKFQIAQFCRTLSTLLAGGTPLVQAMETAGGAIRARLVAGAVTRGAQLVREGQSLHAALASTNLVPELALEMIEVGEASGALAPMLASVSEFYEDDVNTQLANLVALIEPAILIFMAILIAFILVALYLPMFSLSMGGQGQG
jgi:type IV pilus assembly protein PilC